MKTFPPFAILLAALLLTEFSLCCSRRRHVRKPVSRHVPKHVAKPVPSKKVKINKAPVTSDWKKAPCGGGIVGGAVVALRDGNRIEIEWEPTLTNEGKSCKVSISTNGQQFTPLKPLNAHGNEANEFPCKQSVSGSDTNTFKVPDNLKDGNYILQLVWKNSKDTSYACAAVVIEEADCESEDTFVDMAKTNFALVVAGLLGFAGLGILLYKVATRGNEPVPVKTPVAAEETMEEIKDVEKNELNDEAITEDQEACETMENMSPRTYDRLINEAEPLETGFIAQHNVEELVQDVVKNKEAPMVKPIFAIVLDKVFRDSIKKVVKSDQTENVKNYMMPKEAGRVTWTNTHFIFALDCSGSMKGSRWDAVIAGYETFLNNVKDMPSILVSTFTFDIKVNIFTKERSVEQAIKNGTNLPFSGAGTNYRVALEYVLKLIGESVNTNHLVCIMLLSDGLSLYPTRAVKDLKMLRESGRKILFYTIACETNEDQQMIKMATELKGEHYKVVNAEASRVVFSAILKVQPFVT